MEHPLYLKPLRRRFEEERVKLGIAWSIIEQDYLLSWMLAAIASTPALSEHLVFKGGTALKKCYFKNYRFSQDLDFSVSENVPRGESLLSYMQEASKLAAKFISEQNSNVEIKCEKYQEKQPHPFGQEAFVISAKYPWHNDWHTRIMVEVTMEEAVLVQPVSLDILHGYNEQIDQKIKVYALEEIVAEKIRAILQYAKKLHERGWGRSRARDYYDLWRILSQEGSSINFAILPRLVEQKCLVKNIYFTSVEDLFTEVLMTDLQNAWIEWLSPLVPDLPELNIVLASLKESLVKSGLKCL